MEMLVMFSFQPGNKQKTDDDNAGCCKSAASDGRDEQLRVNVFCWEHRFCIAHLGTQQDLN